MEYPLCLLTKRGKNEVDVLRWRCTRVDLSRLNINHSLCYPHLHRRKNFIDKISLHISFALAVTLCLIFTL